jgi:hypothetical protein
MRPHVSNTGRWLAPSPKPATARITQPLAIYLHWYVSIAGRLLVYAAAILANAASATPSLRSHPPRNTR